MGRSTQPAPDDRSRQGCVALNTEQGRGAGGRRLREIRETKRGRGQHLRARSGGRRPEGQGRAWFLRPRTARDPPRHTRRGPLGLGEGRALTHVLRVQLHRRHLLQRDVSRPAVPATPQAAEHRGGHGTKTTDSDAAAARRL